MKKGLFIDFEGNDCLGKSTQIAIAEQALICAGYEVVRLKAPGGTETGQRIRSILLDRETRLDPSVETLLFMADFQASLLEKIIPAVKQGKIVLSDRFEITQMVYQGIVAGQDRYVRQIWMALCELIYTKTHMRIPSPIYALNYDKVDGLDRHTILFTGTSDVAWSRKQNRIGQDNALEPKDVDEFDQRHTGYLKAAHFIPEHHLSIINADLPVERVTDKVISALAAKLNIPKARLELYRNAKARNAYTAGDLSDQLGLGA